MTSAVFEVTSALVGKWTWARTMPKTVSLVAGIRHQRADRHVDDARRISRSCLLDLHTQVSRGSTY